MPAPSPIPTPPDSFDEPWKLILEHYLYDCLTLLFPTVAAAIDWSRPPVPLATELIRITPRSTTGTRSVDWLVKVWLLDGGEHWLLIHIEIQSQQEQTFPERFATYHFHLRITYNRSVLSLAILGDDRPTWRPTRYVDERLGMRLELQFPMVKLLDFREREDDLRASPNPMAILVRAHLATLATGHDALRRKAVKLGLFRDLFRAGYSPADVRQLFTLVDLFMRLLEAMYPEFRESVAAELGEEAMRVMTSFEQYGHKEGLAQGLQQGMQEGQETLTLRQLTRKFGTLSEDVTAQIRALASEQLLALAESLLDFTTPDDLTAWLAANPPVAE